MKLANKKLEQQRFELQSKLDNQKTQFERNKLGQFHTPSILANEILRYASSLLKSKEISFLDPALGTGTFYSALIENFASKDLKHAVGYELDSFYAKPTISFWKKYPIQVRNKDFTKARPDRNYNLIICNPPYVRHHHIENSDKERLQQKSASIGGVKLSGLAGLYCHFLLQCHEWMSDDGIAGWLIPSEFMDVNYGAALKQYLLDKVTLLHIHRFNPTEVQFSDALVSSAVVWIKKAKSPKNHRVRFTYGGSLLKPEIDKTVSVDDLKQELKWSRFPLSDVRVQSNLPTLGDFFKIKRGLATGGNDFFILTEEDIAEKNLPLEFFRPVLPGPRYVTQDVIESDNSGHPVLEKKLFLFDSTMSEKEIEKSYPEMMAYIEEGKQKGFHSGYICSGRSPWYNQEKRPPAPIVCTYMGRSIKNGGHPFRFILNRSKATMTNVYLALYPTKHLESLLAKNEELIEKIWEALNGLSGNEILSESRVYGGGLHKLEPKELARVPLPFMSRFTDILPKHLQYEIPLIRN